MLRYFVPPLELDALESPVLDHLPRALDRLRRRDLIAHERHVADEVRALEPASDRAPVVADVVERHGERVGKPLDDHAERVAHENDVHPRFVDEARHREIVGRDHRHGRCAETHLSAAKLGRGHLA
jgi:hypothetical protein